MTAPKPNGKLDRYHIRKVLDAVKRRGPCPQVNAIAEKVILDYGFQNDDAEFLRRIARDPNNGPQTSGVQ